MISSSVTSVRGCPQRARARLPVADHGIFRRAGRSRRSVVAGTCLASESFQLADEVREF